MKGIEALGHKYSEKPLISMVYFVYPRFFVFVANIENVYRFGSFI